MNQTHEIIRGTIILVVFTILMVWFMYRWLKGSRDPALVVFRWVLTAGALYGLWATGMFIHKNIQAENPLAIPAVFVVLILGGFLAIVWTPVLAGALGKMVGDVFDGGDTEVEAKPFYSVFQAKRSKGQYFEALTEVRQQLSRFPTDYEGQMFLAELQAENLDDLPGAELTIQRLCSQSGHAPVNIAYALNRVADWHLKLTTDRKAAQKALERIMELLPDSEMSQKAAERIAHLGGTGSLIASQDRPKVSVKKGVENLGLYREQGKLKVPEVDQGAVAAEYVKHLQEHPQDSHAREKLAEIYARHYHRLDLAMDQLEQLIQQPNHPPRQVVHWLNLMADLQVKEGASFGQVHDTLQRIIDQYPDLAATDNTRRRMDILKLELKGRETPASVAMGTYPQRLGLNRKA